MNELIRMDGASEFPVSGRELHERLGIETPYHKWFPRMCEYGFEDGKDFQEGFGQNCPKPLGWTTNHRPPTDPEHGQGAVHDPADGTGPGGAAVPDSGGGGVEQPDAIMARALTIANDRVKELTGQVLKLEASNSELTVQTQIMRPKAEYFDELVDRNLLTSFRETAKQLHVKERAFVDFLLSHKYVYRDKKGKLTPYAQHTEKGLFELKECVNEKTQWSGTQTLITPKGRETFRLLCQGL